MIPEIQGLYRDCPVLLSGKSSQIGTQDRAAPQVEPAVSRSSKDRTRNSERSMQLEFAGKSTGLERGAEGGERETEQQSKSASQRGRRTSGLVHTCEETTYDWGKTHQNTRRTIAGVQYAWYENSSCSEKHNAWGIGQNIQKGIDSVVGKKPKCYSSFTLQSLKVRPQRVKLFLSNLTATQNKMEKYL